MQVCIRLGTPFFMRLSASIWALFGVFFYHSTSAFNEGAQPARHARHAVCFLHVLMSSFYMYLLHFLLPLVQGCFFPKSKTSLPCGNADHFSISFFPFFCRSPSSVAQIRRCTRASYTPFCIHRVWFIFMHTLLCSVLSFRYRKCFFPKSTIQSEHVSCSLTHVFDYALHDERYRACQQLLDFLHYHFCWPWCDTFSWFSCFYILIRFARFFVHHLHSLYAVTC